MFVRKDDKVFSLFLVGSFIHLLLYPLLFLCLSTFAVLSIDALVLILFGLC
jgi:hypothetical protein